MGPGGHKPTLTILTTQAPRPGVRPEVLSPVISTAPTPSSWDPVPFQALSPPRLVCFSKQKTHTSQKAGSTYGLKQKTTASCPTPPAKIMLHRRRSLSYFFCSSPLCCKITSYTTCSRVFNSTYQLPATEDEDSASTPHHTHVHTHAHTPLV